MRKVRFLDPAGTARSGAWHGDEVSFGGQTYDLDEIEILPPAEPSKIICVGLNYSDHAEETDSEIPERPLLFFKPPNTVAGHGDTISLPREKERIDYEAELGVVIGEQCRHVQPEDADDVIAGY
ncbi:MAG: fumarylacetoacetate hydrolase family protein, partial [Halobacteriaceae archaeon]